MPILRETNEAPGMRVLSWLRDCLAEDRSGKGVANVFASSVKARRFLDGEDRTTGKPTWLVDLPPSQAQALAEKAALYRRECGFFLGACFLTGRIGGREVIAPVLLFPVAEDGLQGGTFEVDASGWRFNPAVADLLGAPEGWEAQWTPRIEATLGIGGAQTTAGEAVAAICPGLETKPLLVPGNLTKPADLKAAAKGDAPRLHPAAALILVERSLNVRGVLDEIARIAVKEPQGSPLACLFGGQISEPVAKPDCRLENVPAILSTAQENLVRAAAAEPVTVCHGPPGTGKTFTLAAAAIEHASRGESVLVVCRSEKAADVMERGIDRMIGCPDLTLRTGSRQAVKKLRDQIDLLLSSAYGTFDDPHFKTRDRELDRTLEKLGDETRGFERGLAAASRKGEWFDPSGDPGWWTGFRRWLEMEMPGKRPLLMSAADRFGRLQQERIRQAKARVMSWHRHRLGPWLTQKDVREALRLYRNALRRRTSGAWERELAAIHPKLLSSVFPIWIVESDDIHRVLPLTEGLFDLVVIDEASQCDLASAIPAIHRGKRVLIAGDPQQLRHVSFLPEHRLTALAERHGIGQDRRERFHYRRISLIDAALDATDAVHFLGEHFRSRPELIAFSNERFYGKRLRLMRELPEAGPPRPAAVVNAVAGNRDSNGVNRAELEQVADFLRGWLAETRAGGMPRSIGFLSPFRAQVDAFESIVGERLGHESMGRLVRDHDLIVSTAHGFQGDERDVMVLSLALTDTCPAAARRFLEREDVFNVSVTRARDLMVVFCSMDRDRLPRESLLAGWLGSLEPKLRPPEDAPLCRWIEEIGSHLLALGLHCETGQSAGGVPLDLLVSDGKGHRLALDLVGQQGMAGESVPLREQLLLQRAGMKLLPLGIHEWRCDPGRCTATIREMLRG